MTDEFNPNVSLGERLEELEKWLRAFADTTKTQLWFKLAAEQIKDKEERLRVVKEKRREARRVNKLKVIKDDKDKFKRFEKEESLLLSIHGKLRKRNGDIDGLAWSFARHGIFREFGVGKWRGIKSGKTTPHPWLAPVLDDSIQKLAEGLAEQYADIAVAELVIRIPGVIDTTIK